MLNYFKRFICLSIVCILFLFSINTFSENNSATAALSQLLLQLKTYQANFTQLTYDSKGNVIQRSHGYMMIKRPGGFRWESDSPTKQMLITDGNILWVYNVDLAQATKSLVDQKANINPASLLSGSVINLTRAFVISRLHVPGQIFLLQPKQLQGGTQFKWLQLKFVRGELTQMKVLNNLDETSIFDFSHIQMNAPLSSNVFRFAPPAGVDVVVQ